MESILTSIKKLLGVDEVDINFDPDIIMYINGVLMFLEQLGLAMPEGFVITSATEKWTDLLSGKKNIETVKSYIYLKVRLIFDPPTSSFVIDAMERQIKEIEWRLNVQIENVPPATTI